MVSLCGAGLFIVVEMQARAPLIRLSLFADPRLSGSLALTLLVTTVMMTTLVVGPFYLSRGLSLSHTVVGAGVVGRAVAGCARWRAGRTAGRSFRRTAGGAGCLARDGLRLRVIGAAADEFRIACLRVADDGDR